MSDNENSDRLSQSEIDEAWNIFVEEAEEHLGIMENALLTLEGNPEDAETVKQLFRSLHTVKGMAGLQGLGGLHRLSHKTEDVVGLVRDRGATMDSFMIDLLLESTDAIKTMVAESITRRTCSPPSEALLGKLENLLLQYQRKTASASTEDDITEIFDPAESECVAQDPDTMAYFLSMAAEEFRRLQEGFRALKSGDPGGSAAIVQTTETIAFAAGQMGYEPLADALAALGRFASEPPPEGAPVSHIEAGAALLRVVKERLAEVGVAMDDGENAPPVEKESYVSSAPEPAPLTEKLESVEGEPPASLENPPARKEQDLGFERLETLSALVGRLVGSSSMMEHVIAKLAGRDLKGDLTRLERQNVRLSAEGGNRKFLPALDAILTLVDEDYRTLETHYAQLKSTLDQLQEFSTGLRLRPVEAILDSLPSFAADLASQLDKQVTLDIEGAAIKIDGSTLSQVSELITELLGWILIHDMERSEERIRLGKPPAGRIAVKILQNGSSIQVVVESDGRGMDSGQIAAHDIPGLDFAALNDGLRAFRGGLAVTRGAEGGARFAVHIPLSQNVLDGIIVGIGKVRYVVPLDAVRQIMRPEPGQVISSSINGGKSLNLRGEIVPLRFLAGEEVRGATSHALWERMVVVVDTARQPAAFPIDEIVGQQQVLVNPLNGFMKEIKGVAGCSILGGGEVGLVLDIDAMAAKNGDGRPETAVRRQEV